MSLLSGMEHSCFYLEAFEYTTTDAKRAAAAYFYVFGNQKFFRREIGDDDDIAWMISQE